MAHAAAAAGPAAADDDDGYVHNTMTFCLYFLSQQNVRSSISFP